MLYLASPFFKEVENQALDLIEDLMDGADINYFSPRKAPGNNLDIPMDEKLAKAKEIFQKDIDMMEKSGVLLAYTDGYPFESDGVKGIARDAGTSFELGYFFCKQKVMKTPNIVTFSMNDYGSNLMIAQASAVHLKNPDEIRQFFEVAKRMNKAEVVQDDVFWDAVIDTYKKEYKAEGMAADVNNP